MKGIDRFSFNLSEAKLNEYVRLFSSEHKLVTVVSIFVEVEPEIIADHILWQRYPSAFCDIFNLF